MKVEQHCKAVAWIFFVFLFACLLHAPCASAQQVRSAHPDWKNLAAGKKVELKTAPSYPETNDPGDVNQLTDGKYVSAEPMWYDKSCVGWLGAEPVEFTIDLGNVSPIRGVALRFAAGKAGVGWPAKIMLSVSDDGNSFVPLGDVVELNPARPTVTRYDAMWFRAEGLKTHGKFVKFVITPTDTGGGASYVFMDEVEVYKGDDAYLKLAHPQATAAGNPDSPFPALKNIASGQAITFATKPNDPTVSDPEDAQQLVDGKLSAAVPMWNDKSIVGWTTSDPVVLTIDLGSVQPIRGVALRMGAGQAGVEWPSAIQVYVSEKGDKFTPLGDLTQLLAKKPPASGYASFWLATDKLQTHGQFLKVSIAPKNLGNGSYVYFDEVEVYRGDDALLSKPLASVESPQQWRADLAKLEWRDNAQSISGGERPVAIKLIDGKTESGADAKLQQAIVEKEGVTFTLKGEASKPRRMTWTANLASPVSTEKCRFAVLTFRAEGLRRNYEPQPLVALQGVNDSSGENVVALADINLAANDGKSHTLVTQLPEGFTLQQIQTQITTESDAPRLTLERLELLNEAPDVFGAQVAPGSSKPGFVSVELGNALNESMSNWYQRALEKHKRVLDGVRSLKPGILHVSGVPFAIASGANNLAAMPESTPSNEQVEFLGKKVDARYLEPQSRHDVLEIPVDKQAREAFLLLALSAPPIQVLGGQAHTALRLDDFESLSVELTYDKGENELAFPYSLADKASYIPARLIGAYAVAVDPSRKLKKITLHNRHFGPAFALAAITLNASDKSLVPELSTVNPPEQTRQNPDPAAKALAVNAQANRLTISNRWYECSMDLSQGFVIDRYVNRWNESSKVSLSPTSGLRVRVDNSIFTGRCFKATLTKTTKNGAEVKLTSTRADLPLDLDLKITADDTPNLAFSVKATNRGTAPISPEICLPAIQDLVIGDAANTRIFFPQYRNVNTAENVALRAPYGPEFTQQFMDIYSQRAGVGLTVRTDNTEQQMAFFALRKDDTGVSGGVQFSAEYVELAPQASQSFIPVSLIAHNGDWRTAVAQQREWVRSWHKPYRSQDKDYFRNAWEIACYRSSIYLSYLEQRTPPFINEERNKFMTDEVFAFEKKTRGHHADLVHFYNWSYNDERKANDYGVHSTDAIYKHVGGIDFFRKGLDDLQTRLGKPVSLYTIIDRYRSSLIPDKALAEELVKIAWHSEPDKNADASSHVRGAGVADGTYFVRCGHPQWTEFVTNDIIKLQRDTGCKMIYIDVFTFWSHLKGFNGVSPLHATLTVMKKLKEQLPPDVALWAEYPATDFGSQYHDGSLQYYFLHLNEVFARRYNYADKSHDFLREMPINVGRYILPRYKTFGLAGYIEASNSPSQVDAMMVNAEANQEDTWRLHHSRIRERLNRAYDVKHRYTDCFTSDDPSPFVDTQAEGIIANRFPGKNRTAWTLYNARPRTYSGVVLSIPHVEGAKYRDAWNDAELTPTIEKGMALISVRLDPQQPGCVVQELK
jgi:hypothetical protein